MGGFLFGSALPGSSIDSVMVNAHRWRFSGRGALWAQFSGRKTVQGQILENFFLTPTSPYAIISLVDSGH